MGVIILSTVASEYFAKLIQSQLEGSEILKIQRDTFGGGEKYFRLSSDDRMFFVGKEVIFVAAIETDGDLNEVIRVGSTLSASGVKRVIYVISFLAYSSMESARKPNEIVSAKVLAQQLSKIPNGDLRNCFLFMDLHNENLINYFESDCLRFALRAERVLLEAIKELDFSSNFMFGSADLGRPLWVETFANYFKTDLALIRKSRNFKTTKVLAVIGDVRDKDLLIYDDMIRSAGTLLKAGDAYLSNGALGLVAIASHLSLDNDDVINLLQYSKFKTIVTTNSHSMSQRHRVLNSSKFVVKDVSHLFVSAIKRLLGK